jgi:hypothetical protein
VGSHPASLFQTSPDFFGRNFPRHSSFCELQLQQSSVDSQQYLPTDDCLLLTSTLSQKEILCREIQPRSHHDDPNRWQNETTNGQNHLH